MRRLVVASALLIFIGLLLLLPSSSLYSLITTGSSTTTGFAALSSATDDTKTLESVLGLGLIGMGLVLEVLSLFTQVWTPARTVSVPEAKQPEAKKE